MNEFMYQSIWDIYFLKPRGGIKITLIFSSGCQEIQPDWGGHTWLWPSPAGRGQRGQQSQVEDRAMFWSSLMGFWCCLPDCICVFGWGQRGKLLLQGKLRSRGCGSTVPHTSGVGGRGKKMIVIPLCGETATSAIATKKSGSAAWKTESNFAC